MAKAKTFDKAYLQFVKLKSYLYPIEPNTKGKNYTYLLGLKLAYSNFTKKDIKNKNCRDIKNKLRNDFAIRSKKQTPKFLKHSMATLKILCAKK